MSSRACVKRNVGAGMGIPALKRVMVMGMRRKMSGKAEVGEGARCAVVVVVAVAVAVQVGMGNRTLGEVVGELEIGLHLV